MSFFDDEDDIEPEPTQVVRSDGPAASSRGAEDPRPRARTRPSGGSGSGRGYGSGGGPRRSADPAIERRRWVAGGGVVIVIILVVLLISSCQARNTKNALLDYNNSVSSLINRSDSVGHTVLSTLASGQGGSSIAQSLATPLSQARTQLSTAQGLSVPGQMAAAQRNVELAMQMRVDGISQIADAVSSVSGGSGSSANAAIKQIALGTARFYASDVVYIDYAAADITRALHGDNIPVGGNASAQVNSGQFLTNLDWLNPNYVASALKTSYSGGSGSGSSSGAGASQDASQTCQSGQTCVHGDGLSSVAVGSNMMSTSVTNNVSGSPAPTFTLSVLNGGGYNEFDVGCTVSVEGGPSGTGTISETTPGNTSTCNVTLSGTVSPGTYQVTAKVAKVPGETNLTNNSETFSVTFS